MCSHGYHHNGFVATHALGHMYIFISHEYTNISVVLHNFSF